MADIKITSLTANTTPVSTDIVPMVDDPGGTPLTQKITIGNLLKALFTAKGDILVGSGSKTGVVLGVGSDGQVLTADAASSGGVKWATGGGGASYTSATFTNGSLSAGVLTITHSKGTVPFCIVFCDNNGKEVKPDLTFSNNSLACDFTNFGTLSGTWQYSYL